MFTPHQNSAVAILPKFFTSNLQIVFLPHPRNKIQSPFVIFENKIYEVLEVSSHFSNNLANQNTIIGSSFFIGNNVMSNGSLLIASGIHPVIVALPLFLERKKGLDLYDNYFKDTPYESISNCIYPFLDQFGEYDYYDEQKYWSFDESKMLLFLEKKFNRLSEYFSMYYDSSQRVNEKSLDILRHYLPSKYVEKFKCYLCEKNPVKFPKIVYGNYNFLNKMIDTEKDKKKNEKSKIPKLTFKRKKIPKYLINNREITSFFKPQKILA